MTNRVLDTLSIKSGLPKTEIKQLVENSKMYFEKVKVIINGKHREFMIPNDEIKLLQMIISDDFLSYIKVSENAHGYVKGKSIKSNAISHIDKKHFYQTDIKNFFPSIDSNIIYSSLVKMSDLSEQEIFTIIKITAPFGRLDLGSSTSPIISNIVMCDFDMELEKNMTKVIPDLIYTRYSDDITLSSEFQFDNNTVYELLCEKLMKYGFQINDKKTKATIMRDNVKITGIFLNYNGKLTVGTKFKRKIKHCLYLYRRGELQEKTGITSIQLLGMISFLRDIEPDYYEKLVLKYSESTISLIESIKKAE